MCVGMVGGWFGNMYTHESYPTKLYVPCMLLLRLRQRLRWRRHAAGPIPTPLTGLLHIHHRLLLLWGWGWGRGDEGEGGVGGPQGAQPAGGGEAAVCVGVMVSCAVNYR